MPIQTSVNVVWARGGAPVDVSAAGGTLLGIVHRSVHANFLNGLWSRRRNCLANPQINRGAALHWKRTKLQLVSVAGAFYKADGQHLARAFAVEKISSIHTIEQEGVAGVALTVGPYRFVAQAGIRSRSTGKF